MCAFRISGPGLYRKRNGQVVSVRRNFDKQYDLKIWKWVDDGNIARTYRDNGRPWSHGEASDTDIIEKVRAPKRKHRPSKSTKREKTPMTTPNTYIVGKAKGIFRIFQVRKNRLGLKQYYVEHHKKLWVKYSGVITNKSAALASRAAARDVRASKNAGRLK